MVNVESLRFSYNEEEDVDPESIGHDVSTNASATNARDSDPGSAGGNAREYELRNTVIMMEEKAVRFTKLTLLIVLLIFAFFISWATHVFAAKSNQRNFEIEYEGFVQDILTLVQWEVQHNFALMQQMSASITSSALAANASFPFFRIPNYEKSAGYVDGMGGIISCIYAPLILANQRSEWEDFSLQNQDWLQESARLKNVLPNHRDALHGTIQDHEHDRKRRLFAGNREIQEVAAAGLISENIYRWENGTKVVEDVVDAGEVLAPLWQSSPADASAVNVNLFSDPRLLELFSTLEAARQTVLSPNTQIADMFDWMFDLDEKEQKQLPHAFIAEPVYSDFVENPDVVGFLLGVTVYTNLFDRLLPKGAAQVVCVVTDTCGNVMTFGLGSSKAVFLGSEDLHDPAFNSHVREFPLEISYDTIQNPPDSLCVHTVYIYPSKELQDFYNNNNPVIYTTIVATSFFVTALLFLAYSWVVDRRQEKTMQTAVRTDRIVSSLFPENFRDRLIEESKPTKNGSNNGMPLANLFPNVTVMFADLCNFTAWASAREPFQVFLLLETLYGALDGVARRRGIYKVVRKLEVTLGPGTGDLTFRIVVKLLEYVTQYPGPILMWCLTVFFQGVLRGERARFQLFGDAVNYASRMESTGVSGRVQISGKTASLLVTSGKAHWVERRSDTVFAKGKGKVETFFLKNESARNAGRSSQTSSSPSATLGDTHVDPENSSLDVDELKQSRLIDWHCTILAEQLEDIVRSRLARENSSSEGTILDEKVLEQLKSHVVGIASMYRSNAFHDFSHASNVSMSVQKMINRIVHQIGSGSTVSEYAHSIASDSLTKFAVIYAALIHDVDHQGVANNVLVAENSPVASLYNNKSVAENNSISVALDFMGRPDFRELRDCIAPSAKGWKDFQDIVRRAVLATDVFDKELVAQRNEKWKKAFSEDQSSSKNPAIVRLRASVVMEHLIQASDISHCLQHWHVYTKWNEKLFEEMSVAYHAGRVDKNPAESWFQNELNFFDFYVVPLARKVRECQVFGVVSDEMLEYAETNRHEWAVKGKSIVADYVSKYASSDRRLECEIHL